MYHNKGNLHIQYRIINLPQFAALSRTSTIYIINNLAMSMYP